jgi:hypothetical protein
MIFWRLLAVSEARHRQGPATVAESLIESVSEGQLEMPRHLNSYLSTTGVAGQLIVSANMAHMRQK